FGRKTIESSRSSRQRGKNGESFSQPKLSDTTVKVQRILLCSGERRLLARCARQLVAEMFEMFSASCRKLQADSLRSPEHSDHPARIRATLSCIRTHRRNFHYVLRVVID